MYSKTQIKVYLNRYRQLRRVISSLPEHEANEHIVMQNWIQKTACGTARCAAGWAGIDPWFKKQGFRLLETGWPDLVFLPRDKSKPSKYTWDAIYWFFGDRSSTGHDALGALSNKHPVFGGLAYEDKKVKASTVIARIDAEINWLESLRAQS
jgi:hypothetical protein